MRNLAVFAVLVGVNSSGAAESEHVVEIKPAGMFIKDSTLPGEMRRHDVVPRSAVCVQLSRSRWLIVYYTHGFRGVDDERSVLYQVRRDSPDGPVIKEGFLAKVNAAWRPDGVAAPPEGKTYFKQHGHAVAFGVPKGAMIDGKVATHANLFVVQWRVLGRLLVPKEERLLGAVAATQDVEWIQFRLNDREDDIEILQPVGKLRPKGADRLPASMNQSFCQPVPYHRNASEWAVCNHFEGGRLAVLKFRFDPVAKRYDWTETGPFLSDGNRPLTEASLVHFGSDWLITARSAGRITWFKTAKPFAEAPQPSVLNGIANSAPHTTYLCADGIVRLFTGDRAASAQKSDRDPLYAWELSLEESLTARNRRLIYDSLEQKLAMRRVVRPRIDFAMLFPPHGRTQLLVYSVTPRAYNFVYEGPKIPPATAADKAVAGLYFSRIVYKEEVPPAWRFE